MFHMLIVKSLGKALVFLSLFILQSEGLTAQLRGLTSCICPGHVTSYECEVIALDNGVTVWRGSQFNCSLTNNEILLRHSNFNGGTIRTCNSGNIVGRSLSVTNDCYTSRLDINITRDLNFSSVECIYESASALSTIGSAVLSLTKDPVPPPSNIWLMDINSEILTFKWNPVTENCSSLHYNIISDCGDCPKNTTLNSASCTLNQHSVDSRCWFVVNSVVCGNITGNWSDPLYVTVKVPDAPDITNIMSQYGTDDKMKLINLDVKWTEVESINISEGIIGSPLYYSVIFSNVLMGQSATITVCGSANISASRCHNGACTASLPSACYQLDGNISIAVSATNILGEGLKCSTLIARTNQYVDVTFESARRVVCEFVGHQQTLGVRSCSISYGPCQQRLTMTAEGSISTESLTTITIEIDTNLNTYCYSLNASNGSFVWLMEGSYGDNTIRSSGYASAIIITLLSTAVVCCLVINLFCVIKRRHSSRMQEPAVIRYKSYSESAPEGISYTKKRDSELKYTDSVRVEVGLPEIRQINAHVVIELQDKPRELLKALKVFKDLELNIVDILIPTRREWETTKVYFQCDAPLTFKQKRELNEKITETGIVCPVNISDSNDTSIIIDEQRPKTFIGYKYTRILPKQPGSLYNLLQAINGLSSSDTAFNRINIEDIILRQSDDFMVVDLRFICEMPSNWLKQINDAAAEQFDPC